MSDTVRPLRWIGLVGGPLAAALAYVLLPDSYVAANGDVAELAHAGRVTIALMLWMATWWMTEAVAIEATSFLPLVVLPVTGVTSVSGAATPYASPLIFLFLGGFLLALSMQKWGVDRRIALVTLKLVGTRPANMMAGFMVATAAMSACVSNTATVAMMVPIALSVTQVVRDDAQAGAFRVSLLLSIAYAASIGGLATIIGSPPNGFLVQHASDVLDLEISYLDWLTIGLPASAFFLPVTWLLLTRVLFKVPREPVAGGRASVQDGLRELGRPSSGEYVSVAVLLLAVICWVSRPAIAKVLPGITDAGIAITAGLLLFVIPIDRSGTRALDWKATRELPWGVLVLFGGGLSLAASVGASGAADLIGAAARGLGELAPIWTVLGITCVMIFLTELTSNTATVATIVPILVALAPSLGMGPMELAVPATMAASCAFMLPVATPPNAIVFGSGHVPIRQMMRVGLVLNLAAVVVLVILCRVVVPGLG